MAIFTTPKQLLNSPGWHTKTQYFQHVCMILSPAANQHRLWDWIRILAQLVTWMAIKWVSQSEGMFHSIPTIRRKFRSQTSDNMQRWKAEVGRVRTEESRSEKRRDENEWEARRCGCEKGRKVAIHCVFPMIWGSGGSKSNLAKAAGAKPAGQMRDEKLHAVVARSTFRSQNVESTPTSDHFWKLSCRKSARRCGAKHISKSKCLKHTNIGPLLEVEMSKKCTPLWREAHFQVKMYKARHSRTTFWRSDVEKVYAVVARSTFSS